MTSKENTYTNDLYIDTNSNYVDDLKASKEKNHITETFGSYN